MRSATDLCGALPHDNLDRLALIVAMLWSLIGAAWLLSAVGAILCLLAVRELIVLLNEEKTTARGYFPRARVVLCLRGQDPFLSDCIGALLDQDYPDYSVLLIVDSEADPAWASIEPFQNHPRLVAQSLERPLAQCSLKCSSLVQALRQLGPDDEVVALCDSDVIPHRAWLADLTAPLADPSVGCASGIRWYRPGRIELGSLARYAWNAFVTLGTVNTGIAWGGSLAIKRKAVETLDLARLWSQAFCEDTMLHDQLQRIGMRQVFASGALMINRETVAFADFARWSIRQMLCARLYHSRFWILAGIGLAFVMQPLLAAIGAALAWAIGDSLAFGLSMLALVEYQLGALLVIMLVERGIQHRRPAEPGPSARWPSAAAAFALLPVLLVNQLIFPWTLWRAASLRAVAWRGITYQITGNKVTLERHVPYADPKRGSDSL